MKGANGGTVLGARVWNKVSVSRNMRGVYGLGKTRVEELCKAVGILGGTEWGRLTEKQRRLIEGELEKRWLVGPVLRRDAKRRRGTVQPKGRK